MKLSVWFEEMKRRRVFRVLVAYAIAAFAILQVIEPVMHGLALPEWLLKVVVIGLGLGLPVALLLAWAYDIGPRGIERTPSPQGAEARPSARAYRALVLIALGLLLASPAVLYYLVAREPSPRAAVVASPGGTAGPSVAVLPFVNMSDDAANEYFSDGLSEEILNALAHIPGLRVPARTSSFAFKGQAQDVAKIGAALRVANILEGSVRKAGGKVRISAQLVNASDGYHVWSRTYERSLSDVFAIQDEISSDIAGALKVQLLPGADDAATHAGATTNPEAYEAYLLGRHALNQRSRASIEASITSFRKATALDPGFAAAWADQAVATLLLGRGSDTYGELPMKEAIAKARPALQKAQSLAPERAEVLAARGFAEACAGNFQRALDLYDRSLAINPSNGELRNWRALALGNLGRFDQTLAAAAEAVKVDPLSKIALWNYAPMLQEFGRTSEIDAVVERLRALDEGWGEWVLGTLAQDRGERPEAVRHYLQAARLGRDKAASALAIVFAEVGLREEALRAGGVGNVRVLSTLGDWAGALQAARSAAASDPDSLESTALLFGTVYGAGRATEAAELASRLWERGETTAGRFDLLLLLMADAARTAGQGDQAARYRNKGEEMIELARRSGVAADRADRQRAMLAVYDGRDQEAVALLMASLATFAGPRSTLDLPITKRLALRADFQTALRALDATLSDQRLQVVRLLCGPDRISPSWQPAPETCTRLTLAP